jgi:hypothetical protein
MSADPTIKAVQCWVCNGSGHRGMDWCGKCGGTGSQFLLPDGRRFPNTKEGHDQAIAASTASSSKSD